MIYIYMCVCVCVFEILFGLVARGYDIIWNLQDKMMPRLKMQYVHFKLSWVESGLRAINVVHDVHVFSTF